MIPLSRLAITGKPDSTTPRIVLLEILYSHKVRSISEINKIKAVQFNPTRGELEDIAFFINPYEKWQKPNLMKAWKFIQAFMGRKIDVKWTLKNVGLQTNNNPYSLNCCMLYRICIEWSIPLKVTSTIDDMIRMIKISMTAPRKIRKIVCEKASKDYDDIRNNEDLSLKLSAYRNTNRSVDPCTNSEAIAAAALQFKEDLTYSKNPLFDYYSRQLYNDYIDPELVKILRMNRNIINMRKYFNPVFALDYYTKHTLSEMSRKVGFNPRLNELNMYLNMQTNYLTDNFYHGWQVKMLSDESPFTLETLGDYNNVVCYGNFVDGFYGYTFGDLIHIYRVNKKLIKPNTVEVLLDKREVATLLEIADSNCPELAYVIRRIQKSNANDDKAILIFREIYEKLSKPLQEAIYKVLYKLLELGMYMRGWKGVGPYPTSANPLQPQHMMNTARRLKPMIEEYHKNEAAKMVLDLPLYKFSHGTWKKSTSQQDGLTIYERLIIVDKNETVYACMRMSSNWLVSSAHKYFTVIGEPAPFNIRSLTHIS
jgi:hypothetical protein